MSPHPHFTDEAIQDLYQAGVKIENQEFHSDYLKVNNKNNKGGSILLSQSALIQSLL